MLTFPIIYIGIDDDGDNWLNPVYNLAHGREARFCRRPAFPTLPSYHTILCEIPIHLDGHDDDDDGDGHNVKRSNFKYSYALLFHFPHSC